MDIVKKAHYTCPVCQAEIVFGKEDIQSTEQHETEYARGQWDTNKYYTVTIQHLTCPICGDVYILNKTKEEKDYFNLAN